MHAKTARFGQPVGNRLTTDLWRFLA